MLGRLGVPGWFKGLRIWSIGVSLTAGRKQQNQSLRGDSGVAPKKTVEEILANARYFGTEQEYASYVAEAKRETTRLNRVEKALPMILDGVGLNDRYRAPGSGKQQ